MLVCLWLMPSGPLLQVAAGEESAPDIASLEPEEDMTLLDKKLVDKSGALGGLGSYAHLSCIPTCLGWCRENVPIMWTGEKQQLQAHQYAYLCYCWGWPAE